MVSELLKKEKEYYQLNQDIEKKTQHIIQEVNYAMNTADIDFSNRLNYELPKYKKSLNLNEFNCEELNIPECTKDMGVKGFSHFLRATIKAQQMEIKELQNSNKIQLDELKKHQKENKKLNDENEKLCQISIANKNHILKVENQLSSLQSAVQIKDNENVAHKKDIDKLQKELKQISSKSANTESKLLRVQEDSDKYKTGMNSLKEEIKEMKQNNKEQFEGYKMNMKKLEAQKMEILNGFKKQQLLIDNLKKQNVHIQNLKITEKMEDEYMKILNFKFD